MNIIAVVVTYNRMELLKRNIRCLQQNKPISSIVIVNNGSTDGPTLPDGCCRTDTTFTAVIPMWPFLSPTRWDVPAAAYVHPASACTTFKVNV